MTTSLSVQVPRDVFWPIAYPKTLITKFCFWKRVKRHGRMEEMGELAIQFGSLEELNGLIDRLRGQG